MAEKLLHLTDGGIEMDVLGAFCLCDSGKTRDFLQNKVSAISFVALMRRARLPLRFRPFVHRCENGNHGTETL
jgi:hypothetical protein